MLSEIVTYLNVSIEYLPFLFLQKKKKEREREREALVYTVNVTCHCGLTTLRGQVLMNAAVSMI